MATTEDNVRNTLMISDTTFLTTGRVTLAIADALSDIPSQAASDEKAHRYWTCYLLAQRFKMQYVTRSGDRGYSDVDPEVYKTMYDNRLKSISGRKTQKINADNDNVDGSTVY